jgi:hypothetical protein
LLRTFYRTCGLLFRAALFGLLNLDLPFTTWSSLLLGALLGFLGTLHLHLLALNLSFLGTLLVFLCPLNLRRIGLLFALILLQGTGTFFQRTLTAQLGSLTRLGG